MVVRDPAAPLGVLLLAHGARTPRTAEEVAQVAEAVAEARPTWSVATGYIELTLPPFVDALEQLAERVTRIVVAPLFLFRAGHLAEDLPRGLTEVRNRHPELSILVAPPLGLAPKILDLAAERVRSVAPARQEAPVLVVAGRGSSHPEANGDLYKAARLVAERLGLPPTLPCFVGVTEPRLPTTLEHAARLGKSVVVLPYLLFYGRIFERVRGAVAAASALHEDRAWALAMTLGPDSELAAAVVSAVEATLGHEGTSKPRSLVDSHSPQIQRRSP